jgi:hypothetical protein
MRCFRGVSVLEAALGFRTRNDSSALCDGALCCESRFDRCETGSSGSSSSDEITYCADLVVFLGLERVAFDTLGGANVVASLGLGLRRRAMFSSHSRRSGKCIRNVPQ